MPIKLPERMRWVDMSGWLTRTAMGLILDFVSRLEPVQYDVTADRLLNTEYRNTTRKLLRVTVVIETLIAGAIEVEVGDASPPAKIAYKQTTGTTTYENVKITVLDGHYYKITVGAGTHTVISWLETY